MHPYTPRRAAPVGSPRLGPDGREAELAPVAPEFARFENAHRGDDAGDQLRWRHVEAGIARGTPGIGHAHVTEPLRSGAPGSRARVLKHAPGAQHLAPVAFLDRYVAAGRKLPVNGRDRKSV